MRRPNQTHIPPGPPSTSGRSNSPEAPSSSGRPSSPEEFSRSRRPGAPSHVIHADRLRHTLFYKENGEYLPLQRDTETVVVDPYTLGILKNNICTPMYTENRKIAIIDNEKGVVVEIDQKMADNLGIGKPLKSLESGLKKLKKNRQRTH